MNYFFLADVSPIEKNELYAFAATFLTVALVPIVMAFIKDRRERARDKMDYDQQMSADRRQEKFLESIATSNKDIAVAQSAYNTLLTTHIKLTENWHRENLEKMNKLCQANCPFLKPQNVQAEQ